MRFGTKILVLTLAITLGLSGVIVWVVRARITAAETRRAHEKVERAIVDYAQAVENFAGGTARLAQVLLAEPQVRGMLREIDAGDAPEDVEAPLARLRDEVFARQMQRELSEGRIAPAIHVVIDRRGDAVVIAAPQPLDPSAEQRLAALPWPGRVVMDRGESPQFYLVMDERLYLFFAVPLRAAADDAYDFAYFVGYPIDDAWLRRFVQTSGTTDLRAVATYRGSILARSAPPDPAEHEVARLIRTSDVPREQYPIGLRLSAGDQRERFIGAALLIPAPDGGAHFAFFSSLDQALAPLRMLQRDIALVAAVVVVLAVIISQIISRLLAKPVEQLVAGTERIARGQFDRPIDLPRRDELGMLARSLNQMAAGLRQRDVIKDTFGKFVDPGVVRSVMDDPSRLRLGGERRVQTVLFADLENFTAASESLEPETLFRVLNGFLEEAADAVSIHRGIIDKFIGDGMIAFWGPPLEERHAVQACLAALDLVARVRLLEHARGSADPPLPRVRIGIATGEVLVGNIGSGSKYSYTVMGDAANLASRLEGASKLYGTQILATESTVRAAGDAIVSRRIDTVRVIGRQESVEIYEILAEAGSRAEMNGRIDDYAEALRLYEARQFDAAARAFTAIDDAPSRVMADRCDRLRHTDPGAGWDGVWTLDRK